MEQGEVNFNESVFIKKEVCSDDENGLDSLSQNNANIVTDTTKEMLSSQSDLERSKLNKGIKTETSPFHHVIIKEEEDVTAEGDDDNRPVEYLDDYDEIKYDVEQLSVPKCEMGNSSQGAVAGVAPIQTVFVKQESYDEEHFHLPQLPEETFGNHFLSGFADSGETSKTETFQSGEMYIDSSFSSGNQDSSTLSKGLQTCFVDKYSIRVHHRRQRICRLCGCMVKQDCIRQHLKDCHDVKPPQIRCRYCSYQTPYKCGLMAHIKKKHKFDGPIIQCPFCNLLSLSVLEIEEHVQKKHFKPTKYFPCDLCDYKSICRTNLDYHIRAKHTKEMTYICSYCDYKCIQAGVMIRHTLKIHKKIIKKSALKEISSECQNMISTNIEG